MRICNASWRVGTLLGTPLFVDLSWFPILGMAILVYQQNYTQAYSNLPTGMAWIAGALIALLLFSSVLLHEVGHSLVARSQGIRFRSITLFVFGGIALADRDSQAPSRFVRVAMAGPVVNLFIFAVLNLTLYLWPDSSLTAIEFFRHMASDFATINLGLGLVNLMPGLPLDGGEILRGIVLKRTGSPLQGMRWASKIGQGIGGGSLLFGVAIALTQTLGAGLWLSILGWLILLNARRYNRLARLQEVLLTLKVQQVMSQGFRVLDANLTLQQFIDRYLLEAPYPELYFATSQGRYQGAIAVDNLKSLEQSQWNTQTIRSILQPLSQILSVSEKTSLIETINLLEQHQRFQIAVLSPAGAIAGTVDRGDIVQAVAKKLNIAIPEAEIQRIKRTGRYPSGLQLHAIARAAMK